MKTLTFFTALISLTASLQSCTKPDNAKDDTRTTPPPGIGFFFVITDKDSNYLWRFPYYKDSPYDPRKVYWLSESGIIAYPTFQKYQVWENQIRFGATNQIDNIDTGQLVSTNIHTEIKDSFTRNGEHYYIHFPNGDIDTLYYNYWLDYSNKDSSHMYNGKVIDWYRGGGKLTEYIGFFIIVK